MTILKHYRLLASATDSPALLAALEELAAKVAVVPGAIRVDLYRDATDPNRFSMIERWESIEAHKASSAVLGKDAFKVVMGMLSGSPEMETLLPL